MHTLIPTQSEAMCHRFQVRRAMAVGARSGLTSGPGDNGPSSSTIPECRVGPVMSSSFRLFPR